MPAYVRQLPDSGAAGWMLDVAGKLTVPYLLSHDG